MFFIFIFFMLSSKLAAFSTIPTKGGLLHNPMPLSFALVFLVFGCLNHAHFSFLNWLQHIEFGFVYTQLGFFVGVLSNIDSFHSFKTRFYACLASTNYLIVLFTLTLLQEGYRNAAFHIHKFTIFLGIFLLLCLLDCLQSFPSQIPGDKPYIIFNFVLVGVSSIYIAVSFFDKNIFPFPQIGLAQ